MKLIPKYQKGNVINKNTFTSEDIDNPIYSKNKPLSIKEERKIFIDEPRIKGGKQFEKAGRIAAGIARLHPTYGIGMNIIDAIEAGKEKNGEDYLSNIGGASAKIIYKAGNTTPRINVPDYKKARDIFGKKILKRTGIILGAQDYISDIKDLYNEIKTINK